MASTHTRQMGAASSHRRLNRHSVSPPHSILPGSFTIHTLDLRDSHLFHLQRRLFLPRTISRQSSDDGETSIGSKRESLIAMILHFNVKRDILSDYDYDSFLCCRLSGTFLTSNTRLALALCHSILSRRAYIRLGFYTSNFQAAFNILVDRLKSEHSLLLHIISLLVFNGRNWRVVDDDADRVVKKLFFLSLFLWLELAPPKPSLVSIVFHRGQLQLKF